MNPEEESALLARAEAEGVTIDALLRKAVLQIIAAPPEIRQPELNAQEWEEELETWLDGLPDMPILSAEALSRENIYTREDECL